MTQLVKTVLVVKAKLQTQPAAGRRWLNEVACDLDSFDEMLDGGPDLSESFVVIHVNLFVLESAHEPFGFGIIIRVAGATNVIWILFSCNTAT